MAAEARRLALRGCLATLLLSGWVLPSPGAAAICASGHLSLLGADLAAGTVLFGPSGSRDIVALDVGRGRATRYPDGWEVGSRGGSVAGGAILATKPCGPDCLSVVGWEAGTWRPAGEALLVDAASGLVETTRDRSGSAWLALRGGLDPQGRSRLSAYRLQDREWILQGVMRASAIGSPLVSPSPSSSDGIVIGDVELVAGAEAARVLTDRPRAVALEGAQIHWLAAGRPLLVTGNGALYEWIDGKWRPVRWRPDDLPVDGATQVEILPATGAPANRAFVWSAPDPDSATQRLHLVEWTADDGWREVLSLDDGLRTADGEVLPFRHVLRLADGRWLLVAGCVEARGGAGLAYLLLDVEGEGGPVVAPIGER